MLKDRIEILRSAAVIQDSVAEYVNHVIDQLEPFHYEESKMEMFTTHLAMAVQRILTNGEVDTLDDAIWDDVKQSSSFKEAQDLFAELKKDAPVEIPESEEKFLLMHLCNLLLKSE